MYLLDPKGDVVSIDTVPVFGSATEANVTFPSSDVPIHSVGEPAFSS